MKGSERAMDISLKLSENNFRNSLKAQPFLKSYAISAFAAK